MKYKTAIVIGASSGIGREIVRILAQQGVKVAAVARRRALLDELANEFPNQVLAFEHDVLNTGEVPELFLDMTKQLNGLDLFVYCSGVMPEISPTEFNFEKDKSMADVNMVGAIAWCNQAAERFMNTKHGYLVGIGSVAGDRGRQLQPVYNASKAFLHTYLEALRNRLSRYGVVVSTIKPGPVETDLARHMTMSKMPVRTAAEICVSKFDKNGEHYLKLFHRLAFYIIKRIPSPIFRKLKI
ncbi:MAG: SDR family NAD(P)-dependent oxidoreductase [Armatimonadetes bacterium]|nr:SDR family NAD(P)-dependent oxidoreductase [Armatimonadota bacterium]